MNNLYIIAAGLSSRMGGFPKHLCVVDTKLGMTNLEHTITLALPLYDKIYVVVNNKLALDAATQTLNIVNKFENVELKFIESGKGDGHAVYEAIKDETEERVTCIWGDTYFKDTNAFTKVNEAKLMDVVCANEVSPYCYITTNLFGTQYITGMYFNNDKPINKNDKYLHDQSVFMINTTNFKKAFFDYMKFCDDINITYVKTKGIEYSIIKFVNWFNKFNVSLTKFVPIILDKPCSISFNTPEELEKARLTNKKEL